MRKPIFVILLLMICSSNWAQKVMPKQNHIFYSIGYTGNYSWNPSGSTTGLRKIEPTTAEFRIATGVGYIVQSRFYAELDLGSTNNNKNELRYFSNLSLGFTDTFYKKLRFAVFPYYGQFRGRKSYSSGRKDNLGGHVYGLGISLNHEIYKSVGIRFKLLSQYERYPPGLNPKSAGLGLIKRFYLLPLTGLTFRF